MMVAALRLSQPSGKLALRVAEVLADPVSHIDRTVVERLLKNVGGHDLTALPDAKLARRGVNRYLRDLIGLDRTIDEEGLPTTTDLTPEVVDVLEMALGDLKLLDNVRPIIIASICQKEIRGALLKTDRQAISALLGPDCFGFAAREASTFYPSLARLAPEAGTVLRKADGTPFEDHPAADFANKVLLAYLALRHKLAARLFSVRTRGNADVGDLPLVLDAAQQAEIQRLVSRERRP